MYNHKPKKRVIVKIGSINVALESMVHLEYASSESLKSMKLKREATYKGHIMPLVKKSWTTARLPSI